MQKTLKSVIAVTSKKNNARIMHNFRTCTVYTWYAPQKQSLWCFFCPSASHHT